MNVTYTPAHAPARAGVVTLHPANNPSADQPLFAHLAQVLPPLGIAVLSSFLVLVGCSGVSPAEQMRYGTAEHLRRNGFGAADIEELLTARGAAEAYLRGTADLAEVNARLVDAAKRPWWPYAYLPERLGADDTWADMDFDPVPVFARTTCPTLLVYGDKEEWVPVERSVAAWRRARPQARDDVTVTRLSGVGHWPGEERRGVEGVDPRYIAALVRWLGVSPYAGTRDRSVVRKSP